MPITVLLTTHSQRQPSVGSGSRSSAHARPSLITGCVRGAQPKRLTALKCCDRSPTDSSGLLADFAVAVSRPTISQRLSRDVCRVLRTRSRFSPRVVACVETQVPISSLSMGTNHKGGGVGECCEQSLRRAKDKPSVST